MAEYHSHAVGHDMCRVAHAVNGPTNFGAIGCHALAYIDIHSVPHQIVEVQGPELVTHVTRSHGSTIHVDLCE